MIDSSGFNPNTPSGLLFTKYSLLIESHTIHITCMVVSPDDQYLISGSYDSILRIWKISDLLQVSILLGHHSIVLSLAISSDSKYIVSGSSDSTLILWDYQEKRQVAVSASHNSPVVSVAISGNSSHVVSCSRDLIARVWSVPDLQKIYEFFVVLPMVVVTSSNKYIITANGEGQLKALCLETLRPEFTIKCTLEGFHNEVSSITCRGVFVIAGFRNGNFMIFDLEGQIKERAFYTSCSYIEKLELTPDLKHAIICS